MTKDSSSPRVAVVVPCFDQVHHLAESLGSLRAQSFADWCAVVVDDGSAAGEEVAKLVAALADARLEIVRHDDNRGRAAARNSGLRATETELVMMLDANDRLAPEGLARLVAALDEDAARDCAFPDVQHFGRQRDVRTSSAPTGRGPVLDESEVPRVSGTLMRRALLERVGTFDEAAELAPTREDFEFWLRAFLDGCTAEHVAEPLYERRVTYVSFYSWPHDDRVADHVHGKHRAAFAEAGLENAFLARWYARAAQAAYQRRDRKRAYDLSMRASKLDGSVIGRKDALRRLLPGSTSRALDAGSLRRAVPLLGYPLHGAARHRPFFVIGLGHSGNELLRDVLNAHSQLHVPPSTWVLNSCFQKFRQQHRRLTWPDLVAVIMAEFAFHPEFPKLEMDLAPVARRMSFAPPRQRNLAALIDAVQRHHAETHGHTCTRWGDETPLNSLDDATARGDLPKQVGQGVPQTLERLRQVFPDAQFLHLYRDGCEVIGSYLREGVFENLEAGAGRWLNVELQTTRFAAQHSDRSHDVRYEELIAKPEETVRKVCSFLDVEFEAAMLGPEPGPLAPAYGDFDGRARRLFSAEQKQALQHLLGAALAERGYLPATD